MTIVGNSIDPDYQDMVAGDDLILACEVSRANAPVQWYCNDRLLYDDSRTQIESYGTLRKIIISNVQPSDSGKYVCDAVDDKMISVVRIQGTNLEYRYPESLNKKKKAHQKVICFSFLIHQRASSCICEQGE